MNKKKKLNKIWRIIWVVGIYLVLILILCLVVQYKVEWEHKDLNRYLYFYKCNNTEVCTTDIKQNEYYGRVLCKNKVCPYIVEYKGNYAVLNDGNERYIYDYKKEVIFDDSYDDYYFLDDKFIGIMNSENKYGLMNYDNKLVVEPKFNKIVKFQDGYVIYINNNKYGIQNVIVNQDITYGYDEISFINEKYAIVNKNNNYMIYNYNEKKE